MANPANLANLANGNSCVFSQRYTKAVSCVATQQPYIVRVSLRCQETINCPMCCVFSHKRENII